jgi:hypothetical protein
MPNWFWVLLVLLVGGFLIYTLFALRRARRIRDRAIATVYSAGDNGTMVANPFAPEGKPLVNPFEKPETDEQRIRRKLSSGECPDCGSTVFHDRGAMKGDESSIIKFAQCAKCAAQFRIRYIDHPLNPIEAQRNDGQTARTASNRDDPANRSRARTT